MQDRVKSKQKITLEIDTVLAATAATKGLDLAFLLEQALHRQLSVPPGSLNEDDLAAMEAYNQYVAEHGTLAEQWRKF